ncbi:hypothetical protein POM88_010899 [Heracleum sosnowskyi]|uniref:F-box domain-containing protein n=1 Tax=Heracleum sosnowskyi TaxID=360622 RepID=A0AAD8IVP8_9APIA|nr:hypothetical protein POM88_010899 [Heracleum sosnowskyi]
MDELAMDRANWSGNLLHLDFNTKKPTEQRYEVTLAIPRIVSPGIHPTAAAVYIDEIDVFIKSHQGKSCHRSYPCLFDKSELANQNNSINSFVLMELRVKRVKRIEQEIDTSIKQEINISNILPEAVFSNIVSWLPVKEAVRTSILTKRWKHAWKYVTRLDLDPESISKSNVKLVRRDSQNGKKFTPTRRSRADLERCTRSYTSIIRSIQDEVTYCQIVHFPNDINCGDLEKWVEELFMKKKVKALSLKCYEKPTPDREYFVKPLVLRPGIFSPLEFLELTCYRLFNTSPFQSCEKLRILKLSSLVLDTKSITEIFSLCKSLEELSMVDCYGFSELKISSRNIKFLELRCLDIDNINISAEALTTLTVDKISCKWSSVVIDAPRVTEVQAYSNVEGVCQELREMYLCQEKLLERCTGFLSCHERSHPLYSPQMGYVSVFRNLQSLSTSLDLNDIRHAILLSYVFRVCFQLKKLDINVEVRDPCKVGNLYYPEHLFWEKKESFDCISNCLRAVSIQNFRGKVLEMEFVRYVITRAQSMHQVTVRCAADCTAEELTATRNLLSFPKSSMDISVVIVPPSPTAG